MMLVFGLIVVLALLGLTVGIYAVRKVNPRWLRIQTRVWRVRRSPWSWARRSRQGSWSQARAGNAPAIRREPCKVNSRTRPCNHSAVRNLLGDDKSASNAKESVFSMLDFRSTCKSGSILPAAAPTDPAETVGRVAHVAADLRRVHDRGSARGSHQ